MLNFLKQVKANPVPAVEQRYSIHFSISKADKSLIEEARVALSSRFPKGASLEELFTEGLRRILKHKQKKMKALGSKRSKLLVTSKRTATAKMQKEVRERDRHCCSYVYNDGSRCCSTWNLELDHVKPVSLGGETAPDNLRLLCSPGRSFV